MTPPTDWWVFPLVMPVVMLVVGFFMMRMMRGMFFSDGPPWGACRRDRGHIDDHGGEGGEDRALSILRERYAQGEIPLEEYERRVGPLVVHEAVRDGR